MTHGIVITENSVEAPTHCAEKAGAVSYSSANILVLDADGIAAAAVTNSTHISEKPSSFIIMQKISGSTKSFKMER